MDNQKNLDKLKEFLGKESPEEYDFVNEIASTYTDEVIKKQVGNNEKLKSAGKELLELCKKIIEEQNPIAKFLYYYNDTGPMEKKLQDEEENKYLFDCDSYNGTCDLANAIYGTLWDWDWDLNKCKNELRATPESLKGKFPKWDEINSDTMNSFKTTHSAAKKIYKNAEQKEFENADDNPYLQKFARLTHSIGNFTLIPLKLRGEYFNGNRGYFDYEKKTKNTLFVHDYWDLSLKLLKDELTHDEFKSYIDTFFLNDYVDADYNIIPLMESHEKFLKRSKLELPLEPPESKSDFLPKSEKELNEYLKNVICKIKLRGIRMVHELRKS